MAFSRKGSEVSAATAKTGVSSGAPTEETSPIARTTQAKFDDDAAIQSEEEQVQEIESHDTLTSNESEVSELSITRRREASKKFSIPLEVQVVLGIMIPIGFLCGIAGTKVNEVMSEKSFIDAHETVIMTAFDCQNKLMTERLWSTRYLFSDYKMGAQGHDEIYTELTRSRELTDVACAAAKEAVGESSDEEIAKLHTMTELEKWEELIEARYRVDNHLIRGNESREIFTSLVYVVTSPVAMIAKRAPLSGHQLMMLWIARSFSNYLGWTRDTGMEMLIVESQSSVTVVNPWLLAEFLRASTFFNRSMNSLQKQKETESDEYLHHLVKSPAYILFRWLAVKMESTNFTWHMEVTPIYWIDVSTRPFDVLALLDRNLQRETLEYKIINNEFRTYLTGLIAAIICSTAATAWIIYEQHKATQKMKVTRDRVMSMQRSASSFVPRTFLKLMGCTSITHVTAGDATNVAVTLVSCRISDFTLLSEAMSSEELFKWLQDYFNRVTKVVERHDGFIDKFIGDTCLCVFQSAAAAVQCAIAIQGAADVINIERIQRRSEHLVILGIGVNSCVVSAGIMGSKLRKESAIVSSEVSFAAQLEALTSIYGVRILVSGDTFDQCVASSFEHRRIGVVKFGTKSIELVEVFQADPLPIKKFKKDVAHDFDEAMECIRTGDLEDAEIILKDLQRKADDLKVVDKVMNALLNSEVMAMNAAVAGMDI